MNKEQTIAAIAVMQAYVDGKEIEWQPANISFSAWAASPSPHWNWATSVYRVNPFTKPSINWEHVAPEYKWMATDRDGNSYLYSELPQQAMGVGSGYWVQAKHAPVANSFVSYKAGTCDWKDSLVERPNV